MIRRGRLHSLYPGTYLSRTSLRSKVFLRFIIKVPSVIGLLLMMSYRVISYHYKVILILHFLFQRYRIVSSLLITKSFLFVIPYPNDVVLYHSSVSLFQIHVSIHSVIRISHEGIISKAFLRYSGPPPFVRG